MSPKYIDFVPNKKPTTTPAHRPARSATPVSVSHPAKASRPSATSRATQSQFTKRHAASVARSNTAVKQPIVKPATPASSGTFSIKKEPAYGVIEDFHPKFVKTEVEKRPLSRSHFTTTRSELSQLKSQNLKKSSHQAPPEQPTDTTSDKSSLPIPKSPFIAKAKVSKRPLSKNVYTKPVQPTKEPSTPKPVTIISKPESGGKAGMAIAIILTIILGAVAGTIAFLILPK